MNKILLVEDDISLIDGLKYSLRKQEFDVEVVRTVEDAKKQLIYIDRYDLIILDVTLPDGTGFDICERVRKRNKYIPIIFLTASIRALLRRASMSTKDTMTVLECGDISIDLLGSCVFLKGKIIELTNAEYRLLCLLVKNVNRIVSREYILHELWDDTGNYVDDNTLSVYIRRLREKIEIDASHPQHLITVRGFGYKWKEVEI